MANLKISQLPADTAPSGDDLIPTVHDPGGTPANRKVTIADLLKRLFTSDDAELTVGADEDIPDGSFLKRDGDSIVGGTPAGGGGGGGTQEVVTNPGSVFAYTIVSGDGGKLLVNNRAGYAWTLPNPATVGNGWWVDIMHGHSGDISFGLGIVRHHASVTINGAASNFTFRGGPYQCLRFISDGTNWWVENPLSQNILDGGQGTIVLRGDDSGNSTLFFNNGGTFAPKIDMNGGVMRFWQMWTTLIARFDRVRAVDGIYTFNDTDTIKDLTGEGSPEGVVAAAVGSTYRNKTATGASDVFWVKATGTGNTGWVAK